MNQDQLETLTDALTPIKEAIDDIAAEIRDAGRSDAVDGSASLSEALDGIAEAIGRHAAAQASTPLRDYFAGQALIALITTGGTPEGSSDLTSGEDASLVQDARCSGWGAPIPHTEDENGQPISYAEEFADEAYALADAMIWRRARA